MTVQRRKDTRTPRVFMHKVADIRGGVSVKISELGGDYLREGAVLSAPDNGICHVVKIAEVVAEVGASDTAIKVKKLHNFKVGDFVMTAEGGLAYAITAIDESNKDYDTITVGYYLESYRKGWFPYRSCGAVHIEHIEAEIHAALPRGNGQACGQWAEPRHRRLAYRRDERQSAAGVCG